MFDAPDLTPEVAASAFAALGSEQRLAVLRILVRAGPEGVSIGELGRRCGISGSTLTHHMKILTQAGLARQEKAGRQVICAAASYAEVRALSDYLLRECCADSETMDHRHD
jgi:DNA-binding transcriptional ArsR family regulator